MLKMLTRQELLDEIEVLKKVIADLCDYKREFKVREKELEEEILRLMTELRDAKNGLNSGK